MYRPAVVVAAEALRGCRHAVGLGEPHCGDRPRREDEERQPEHPLGAELKERHTEGRHGEAGKSRQHRQLGVGAGEIVLALGHRRDEGRLPDEVELREDEDSERLGEQQEALQVPSHEQRQNGTPAGGYPDARPAGRRPPVEEGAEQRGHDGKRRDREQEVEEHSALRLAGADREEQRSGKRDRHERRAAGEDRVHEGEAAERLVLVEQATERGSAGGSSTDARGSSLPQGHGRC